MKENDDIIIVIIEEAQIPVVSDGDGQWHRFENNGKWKRQTFKTDKTMINEKY